MKEKCTVLQVPVCSLPLGPLLGELPGLHLLVEGGKDLLHVAAALTQQECLRLLEPSRTINLWANSLERLTANANTAAIL